MITPPFQTASKSYELRQIDKGYTMYMKIEITMYNAYFSTIFEKVKEYCSFIQEAGELDLKVKVKNEIFFWTCEECALLNVEQKGQIFKKMVYAFESHEIPHFPYELIQAFMS